MKDTLTIHIASAIKVVLIEGLRDRAREERIQEMNDSNIFSRGNFDYTFDEQGFKRTPKGKADCRVIRA